MAYICLGSSDVHECLAGRATVLPRWMRIWASVRCGEVVSQIDSVPAIPGRPVVKVPEGAEFWRPRICNISRNVAIGSRQPGIWGGQVSEQSTEHRAHQQLAWRAYRECTRSRRHIYIYVRSTIPDPPSHPYILPHAQTHPQTKANQTKSDQPPQPWLSDSATLLRTSRWVRVRTDQVRTNVLDHPLTPSRPTPARAPSA